MDVRLLVFLASPNIRYSCDIVGTIRNADNILVLKDGAVAEEGTHDELVAKNGVYAEMWNMQLHSNSGSQASLGALDT